MQAAIVGGIALSAHLIFDKLKEWLRTNVAASIALLIVATLVFKLAEVAAELAIEHSMLLRKSILGSHFIEGRWINTVQDPQKNGSVDSIGLMEIIFRDGKYLVSGESLALNGEHLGNFKHEASLYSDYALRFSFSGANRRDNDATVEGFGEYRFTPTLHAPRSFDGFVQDTFYQYRMSVYGIRITDRDKLASINDIATRRSLIADLVNNVAPKRGAG